MIQLTLAHHWLRYWLGGEWATSHFLAQRCPWLLEHICVARPQWVALICGSKSLLINKENWRNLNWFCSQHSVYRKPYRVKADEYPCLCIMNDIYLQPKHKELYLVENCNGSCENNQTIQTSWPSMIFWQILWHYIYSNHLIIILQIPVQITVSELG